MDAVQLRRQAHGQLGLFTRAQALECGASLYQIRRRIAAGEWCPVMGAVLAFAELPLEPRRRDLAATLAVPGGVLVGPSAARVWQIPVPDERTYLAVGRDRHPPAFADVRYLRCTVDGRDLTRWGRAPVSSPTRSVVDCLTIVPERDADDLLDRALQRGWLTLDELATRIQARVGREGTRRLLRLLRSRTNGTRSVAERLCAKILTAASLTGWQANVPLHDGEGLIGVVDFLFAEARLAIEIDGRAYHQGTREFQHDRVRQNRLVAAGWTVLRFTWYDLTERPEYVVAAVRAMLAGR